MAHAKRRGAHEPVAQQQQCRQDEDDAEHTDDGAARHEHAHRADDVDVGIDGHAERCGEQAHAADDDRGDRRRKRGDNGRPLLLARKALGLKRVVIRMA